MPKTICELSIPNGMVREVYSVEVDETSEPAISIRTCLDTEDDFGGLCQVIYIDRTVACRIGAALFLAEASLEPTDIVVGREWPR